MKICINGKFFEEKDARISVLDNGFLYGDGVFDTLRTYDGKFLEPELHLKRLKEGAGTLKITYPWSVREISELLRKLARVNHLKEARVRVSITRGSNGFDFLSSKKPLLVITCEKLKREPELYRDGVSAITMKLERSLPEIKTIGMSVMILARQQIARSKAFEAILVDDQGYVREGASTNVFMVKKGKIFTPSTKILGGLTRDRILALTKKTVKVQDFKLAALKTADEIFITNRPREIIPVVILDGKKVGNGKVGPMTKLLIKVYREHVRKTLGKA